MKKALALLALVLAALALVACGSDSGTTTEAETETSSGAAAGESERNPAEKPGGEASSVEIEADPGGELAYTQEEVTAKAGDVTIDFNNPQPIGHDVDVETSGGEEIGKTELIAEGSESVTLKA